MKVEFFAGPLCGDVRDIELTWPLPCDFAVPVGNPLLWSVAEAVADRPIPVAVYRHLKPGRAVYVGEGHR